MSLLPTELKTQIFSEISDRETLLGLSQVSKQFSAVFNSRKEEFYNSAYAEEFRTGKLTFDDAIYAIIKHIKGDPKASLVCFEAAWKAIFYSGPSVYSRDHRNMNQLLRGLGTKDYSALLSSLHTIYDHVVLETSWPAWAGAITAIGYFRPDSDETDGIGIKMQSWILDQFSSRQRELIGLGVPKLQEDAADCVLLELEKYHKKKRHFGNLAEVLRAMLHLNYPSSWGYKLVAQLVLLEVRGLGRHADFHGGVQCICDPSTCRHTADFNDILRALEEICIDLIFKSRLAEARRAMSIFERMPSYYNHIVTERLERVQIAYYRRPNDDDADL